MIGLGIVRDESGFYRPTQRPIPPRYPCENDGMALRERIQKLREEIAEIRRQNEEYLRPHRRTLCEITQHRERFERLDVILRELSDLLKDLGPE